MKKAIIAGLILLASCKEPAAYWNPGGTFPLLETTGQVSKTETFALDKVSDDREILIINFFAPDCKPCIMEVPDLKIIYNQIKDNPKISFVAIGARLNSLYEEDVKDSQVVAAEILKFVKAYKLPYPAYIGLSAELKNYGLTGFPETFVLHRTKERKWFVKRRFVGMISEKDIKPFIK